MSEAPRHALVKMKQGTHPAVKSNNAVVHGVLFVNVGIRARPRIRVGPLGAECTRESVDELGALSRRRKIHQQHMSQYHSPRRGSKGRLTSR